MRNKDRDLQSQLMFLQVDQLALKLVCVEKPSILGPSLVTRCSERDTLPKHARCRYALLVERVGGRWRANRWG